MEDEIWKELPGFPDYLVSNMGNVLSNRHSKPVLLKLTKDRHSRNKNLYYHRVKLYPPIGKRKNFRVHELVMLAFSGKTPDGKVITHKNGNTLDDKFENLEFISSTISSELMYKARHKELSNEQ